MRLKRGRDVVGKETKDPKVYHEKISKYKKMNLFTTEYQKRELLL